MKGEIWDKPEIRYRIQVQTGLQEVPSEPVPAPEDDSVLVEEGGRTAPNIS